MSLASDNCHQSEQNLRQMIITKKINNRHKQQQTMAGPPETLAAAAAVEQQCSNNNETLTKAPRRRTFNEISTLRRPRQSTMVIGGRPLVGQNKSRHQLKKMATNYLARRSLCHLVCSLGALCLILLVAIVTAESFNSNSAQQQQQEGSSAQAGGHNNQQKEQADFAVAASNNYQQQHQSTGDQLGHHGANGNGQSTGQKSKKIQIVYIKVPLAKLRPSLSGQDSYSSAASNGANSSSSLASTKTNEQYETNSDSKSQQQAAAAGSQQQQMGFADEQQQQQMNLNDFNDNDSQQRQVDVGSGGSSSARYGGGFHQAQSFLIPMAVVQTSQSSNEFGQQQGDPFSYEMLDRHHQSMMANNQNGMGSASSQLHPQHAQPNDFTTTTTGGNHHYSHTQDSPMHSGRVRSPSMNLQEHNRQQQFASSAAPISHGFMSSFLLGEKEKMTAAAMRLQKQRQLSSSAQTSATTATAASAVTASVVGVTPAYGNHQQQQTQVVSAASQANQQQVSAPSNNQESSYQNQPPSSLSLNPKGPGGLMPSMIAPLSRMPDNAIGQAYGAAVGIALPAESGSPSSLLSSSSSMPNSYGKQQQPRTAASNSNTNISNNNSSYGTNNGMPGEGAYSSGTGSSTSYGANGLNQQGDGSSGRNYQQSSQSFAATGHSSNYGNGINTSGASGAFSDYPAGSSNSNNYNHQQQQQSNSHDYNGRLKQAKKTIIPIVVQVEHAILEGNNNAVANAYQQHNTMRATGNKYGAGGNRSNRQLDGKRGSRYNSNKGNQLYGAATNEIAQYGDIPPGAQWINAANAYDINQITAQINAENAASAAAALAQADAAFGPGAPAGYSPPNHSGPRYPVQRPSGHSNAGNNGNGQGGNQGGNQGGSSAYAAGLQNAASALLANTHPMIQAAASGGLASVSKLGAKLGEMIALPSMQMPNSIASIGSSLPTAFSSITNQMGAQLGQAVQQVAKEHPHASAFARQVAQQAGIQLPNFGGPQQIGANSHQSGSQGAQSSMQHSNGGQHQQQQAASSNQHVSQLSPQAQLQNLKLSIGQNLQTAAASLIGVNQKANALTGNQLLGNANQMAFSAALKQLSAISPAAAQLANQLAGSVQAAASNQQQTAVAPPSDSTGNSGLSNVQQGQMNAFNQFMQQQQQVYNQLANFQQSNQPAPGSSDSSASPSASGSLETSASSTKPVKASSFKSKFLSFFQPPKFISNFLNWNDRADARNDKGETGEIQIDLASFVDKLEEASSSSNKNSTTATTKITNNTTTSLAPSTSTNVTTTTTTTTAAASRSTGQQTNTSTTLAAQKATSVAPMSTTISASASMNQKETTPKVKEMPSATNVTTKNM